MLTGLAGGLAGCAGQSEMSSRSVSETNRPTIPDDNAATAPPLLHRRSTATQSPIRLRAEQVQASEAQTDDESHYRLPQDTNEVIDTAAKADRLVDTVAGDDTDNDDTGGANELSAFIGATDFERETLYLETHRVEQCYRLSLCYVSWQETEIRTAYSRRLRPYDEACAADRQAIESRLIRLPVALTADSITGVGTSIGSARCRQVVEPSVNGSTASNGTATNARASSGGSA